MDNENDVVIRESGLPMRIMTVLIFLCYSACAVISLILFKGERYPGIPLYSLDYILSSLISLGILIAGLSPVRDAQNGVGRNIVWSAGTLIARLGCILLITVKILEIPASFALSLLAGPLSIVRVIFAVAFCVIIFVKTDDIAGTLKGRYKKTGSAPAFLALLSLIAGVYAVISSVLSLLSVPYGSLFVYSIILMTDAGPIKNALIIMMLLTIIARLLLFSGFLKWYSASRSGEGSDAEEDREL